MIVANGFWDMAEKSEGVELEGGGGMVFPELLVEPLMEVLELEMEVLELAMEVLELAMEFLEIKDGVSGGSDGVSGGSAGVSGASKEFPELLMEI